MGRFFLIICFVGLVVAIFAIRRFATPTVVVVEVEPTRVYDTIKIIEISEKKFIRAKNIDLNRADTAQLKRIYGVGTVFAARIVEYRQRLGGYHSNEQLKEVRGIDDEVFAKIVPNIFVDTLAIQKIKINFATRKQLEAHPYITPSMAERLAKAVEMKGGYATLRQLLDDNILLPKEAQRVAPYVSFSQNQ